MSPPSSRTAPGAWSPLRQPLYRSLWIATLVASVGTWMREVGAGWLMVTLAPTPLWVALVQAASALPIFLLSIPAGALADIVDRRRFLIGVQVWMLVASGLLALLAALDLVTAPVLLVFTFLLGMGAAAMMPAWAATIPELVSRENLPAAVALHSTGVNVARTVGPALGGVIIAAAGPAATFALNALSFVGVIVVLVRWRREHETSALPAERFVGAVRAGVRYVVGAPALQRVMLRAAVFFLFGSALWALLPLVAKALGGPRTYGTLLACLGAGAVAGALVLPGLRERLSRDALVRGATVLLAASMLTLGLVHSLAAAVAAMAGAGLSWISALSSFHVSAQTVVPGWVRARALAIYMLAFAAAMTFGSWLWGVVATHGGVGTALAIAAAGALAGVALTWRASLDAAGEADALEPAVWPAPAPAVAPEPDRGPVLITVDYRVRTQDRERFRSAIAELEPIRRRDGAISWTLYEDAEQPGRYVETFLLESWDEHVRQHGRAMGADARLLAAVRAFDTRPGGPRVEHLIAVGRHAE
jgi:MFS family permease